MAKEEEGTSRIIGPPGDIVIPDDAAIRQATEAYRSASAYQWPRTAGVRSDGPTTPVDPRRYTADLESARTYFANGFSRAIQPGITAEAAGTPSAQRAREKAYWDPTRSPTLWMIPFNIQTDPEQFKRLYQWTQFFYATHYLFPTLVDIYARFPLVGFEHQCKDPYIKKFFDHVFLEQMDYMSFLLDLNTEYWKTGECVEPGTRIRLADGSVKPVEEMQIGDGVITHTGSIGAVTERFKRNSVKELFEVRINGLGRPLRLTGNHPVWAVKGSEITCDVDGKQQCWPDDTCSLTQAYRRMDGTEARCNAKRDCVGLEWNFRWMPAKELEKGDYVVSPVENDVDEEFSASITPEWARLFGYYVSEGSFLRGYCKKDVEPGYILGVQISNTDPELIAEVETLARKVTDGKIYRKMMKARKEGHKDCDSVCIWDKELAEQFLEHGGLHAKNKRLSAEFMRAATELQKEFVEAYINGDGGVDKQRGRVELYTSSEALANQLLAICNRLGMPGCINERVVVQHPSSVVEKWGDGGPSYSVRLSASEADGVIVNLVSGKRVRLIGPERPMRRSRPIEAGFVRRVMSVEKVPYDGYVYNLEVEGDNSYVAEGVAVHNCLPMADWSEALGCWVADELMSPIHVRCEVYPILGQRRFIFEPPTYLQEIATKGRPYTEYQILTQNLSEDIVKSIQAGHGFELSPDRITQLKRGPRWAPRGEPLLMRILRHLMIEEKLLRAFHSITERMITPLILAKLGDVGIQTPDGVPWIPMQADVNNLQRIIEEAMDSDYKVLATHFAVTIENVLGYEVMPKLGDEFAAIEEKMCMIFGISLDILKGGGSAPFASTALSADILSQNLAHNQHMLKKFLLENRYTQVCDAHEFYDYNLKGGRREIIYERVQTVNADGEVEVREEPKLLLPDIHLASMNLRDEATQRQFLTELRQMGVPISDNAMMVGVDYDFDDEVDKIKTELVSHEIAKAETRIELENAFRAHDMPVDKEYIAKVVDERFGGETPDTFFQDEGGKLTSDMESGPDMMKDKDTGTSRTKARPDISDDMKGKGTPEDIAGAPKPKGAPAGGGAGAGGAPAGGGAGAGGAPAGGGGAPAGGGGAAGAHVMYDKDGEKVVRRTFEDQDADRASESYQKLSTIGALAKAASLRPEDVEAIEKRLAELAKEAENVDEDTETEGESPDAETAGGGEDDRE